MGEQLPKDLQQEVEKFAARKNAEALEANRIAELENMDPIDRFTNFAKAFHKRKFYNRVLYPTTVALIGEACLIPLVSTDYKLALPIALLGAVGIVSSVLSGEKEGEFKSRLSHELSQLPPSVIEEATQKQKITKKKNEEKPKRQNLILGDDGEIQTPESNESESLDHLLNSK